MPEEPSDRIDRIVSDLLKGKRLKVGPGDAAERKAILAAARLAASREGYPRMSPALRRRIGAALGREQQQGWVSRRTALLGGLSAAAGALAGVGLSRAGQFAPAPITATSTPASPAVIDPRPGRWVDVAALADLPEGEGYRVKAGSVGAYLFRSGGKVTAVSSICSHLPCELDWLSDRGLLNCPCHNAAFQPDGESIAIGYALPRLPAVQVKVVDGRVLVLGT